MENPRQGPNGGDERPEPGTDDPQQPAGSDGPLPPGGPPSSDPPSSDPPSSDPPSSSVPGESVPASGGRGSRKRTAIIASLAGVVGLVAIVAVGAALGFVPIPGFIWGSLTGAQPPEHSARYYPDDTLVYAWMTLAPGGGQFENSRDIWERLNEIRAFEDLYDQINESLDDEFETELEDLTEWVGPDFSVAVASGDRASEPLYAITVGVRDHGAAEDFVDDMLDIMESDNADFDSDSYQGFDIWVEERHDVAFGLSRNLLAIASNEDFLEEVIDGINGDLRETLADDTSFQEARAALPERRFASIYVGVDAFLDDDDFYLGEYEEVANDLLPDWTALSAGWGDRSVSVEMVMPSLLEHALDLPSLESPAGALPDDTAFLVSLAFDPDLDNWRDTLSEYRIADVLGEDAADDIYDTTDMVGYFVDADDLPDPDRQPGFDFFIDLAIAVVDEATGVDLEEDLLDHLEGDLSFAGWDFAFNDYGSVDLEDTLNLVALLSYKSSGEETLADSLADLQDYAEDEGGMNFDSVDVGADRDAHIVEIDDDYSPGYVMNDGYLVIGSTEDSLQDTVQLQQGRGANLASNPEYQRVVALLPGDRHFLAYVNISEILRESHPEAFNEADIEADIDLYSYYHSFDAEDIDQMELWGDSIGAAAVSYTLGNRDEDGLDRYSVVLTLFPE